MEENNSIILLIIILISCISTINMAALKVLSKYKNNLCISWLHNIQVVVSIGIAFTVSYVFFVVAGCYNVHYNILKNRAFKLVLIVLCIYAFSITVYIIYKRKLEDGNTLIKNILYNIDNPIVIISKNMVCDCNTSFREVFGEFKINNTIFFQTIEYNNRNYYIHKKLIHSLYDRDDSIILYFIDITEEEKLLKSLKLTSEHMQMVSELINKSVTNIEFLTKIHKKKELSMYLHDEVGYNLTLLIALINQLDKENSKCTQQQLMKKIYNLISEGENRLDALYKSDNNIQDIDRLKMTLSLYSDYFDWLGISISINIQEYTGIISEAIISTVSKICKESFSNTLRHSNAKHISADICFKEGFLKLYISDDGTCKLPVIEGNGLNNMRERIKEVSGYFSYEADQGFKIKIQMPLRKEMVNA